MEVLQESVVPLRRVIGPRAFEAARDRVRSLPAAEFVLPSEPLLLNAGALRFGADVLKGGGCAMSLADRVAADDERESLLVIHRHAGERLTNVLPGQGRIRGAARPLWVHVDQAHVIGADRAMEFTLTAMALVSKPGVLRAPEDLVGFPAVLSPEAEAERIESHRLICHVAGKGDQIGPGDLPTVLLFDRPEQPARLIEARVVGPTVEGGKPLHAVAGAAPAIRDAVCAGGMPRHPDEERSVMAIIGRPPILRRRHQPNEIPPPRL